MNRCLPVLLACVLIVSGCALKHRDYGRWCEILPEDSDYFYAVGGPSSTRQAANDNARSEMGKFISVTVDSEIESWKRERNDGIDQERLEQLRLESKETLRYLSIAAVKREDGGYLALARMPRRPLNEIMESLRFEWMPPSLGEMARSALVPGWGQLEKKQTRKGLGILSSQVVLLGSTLIFNSLKTSAHDDYLLARTDGVRRAYRDDEDNYQRLMTGSLVGLGAVYIYNLIDVSTADKKVLIRDKSVSVEFNYPDTKLVYRFP